MEQVLGLMGLCGMAFMVGLSGAMMPGPLLAVTIRESSRRGTAAGPLIVAGHAVLEAALVACVVAGAGAWLRRPPVMGTISVVGGVVMCLMGVGMARSARTLPTEAAGGDQRGLHPVATGVLVSLSNPYWTIWWVTIGLGYLATGLRYGWLGIIVFFAGHIASDFTWYTLVSYAVSRGRRIIGGRFYRGMIAVCGVAMVAFGAWFLQSAYDIWTGWR